MFTGLVEEIGHVLSVLDSETEGRVLEIKAKLVLQDCRLGDSIAVNGTCLTVTSFTSDAFKVGMAPETLRKTNLGSLTTGALVNLERSLSATQRFGGHFVQVLTPSSLFLH
jgi:riboflavin synthase